MTEWYVKDLSKLTHVSVQTLHHYDRIGLLIPSIRLPNGYRIYSEKDLLKLQQIVALKFFGFELTQIKTLLSNEVNVLDHFQSQARLLEEKAHALFEASNTLKNLVSTCDNNKSIPWKKVVETIEVYRMTKELENTWASKVFNANELRDYANFEKDYLARYDAKERAQLDKEWQQLLNEVKANLHQDPMSNIGANLGKRLMHWVNTVYGSNIAIRNAMWNKGFKEGNLDPQDNIPTEYVVWLDKAIDAYYRDRVHAILRKINQEDDTVVLREWKELLQEMFGADLEDAKRFVESVVENISLSQDVKSWLKKIVQ